MLVHRQIVDANRKSFGLLLFFSLGSTVGKVDKRADSSDFAVLEWPALGLPLSITCCERRRRAGQRLFREHLLADVTW